MSSNTSNTATQTKESYKDYKEYLQLNGILTEEQFRSVLTNAAINRTTVFAEMQQNYERYKIKEQDVLDSYISYASTTKDSVILLETTRNVASYTKGMKELGGIELCVQKQILPLISEEQNAIVFVVKKPDDVNLVAGISKVMQSTPHIIAICPQFIYNSLFAMFLEPLLVENSARKLIESEKGRDGLEAARHQDSEVRKIYSRMLNLGIERNASDVHILPCKDHSKIIYRIDGINYTLMEMPLEIGNRVCNILCTDASIARRGDFTVADGKLQFEPESDPEHPRDLRFSLIPSTKGIDINIRYLTNKAFSFEDLGMTKKNVETYKSLLNRPQGLIVMTGPTGSGKSTSLYAGLSYVNSISLRNIVTVEDPVEITFDGITQVSTNDSTGLTFEKVAQQMLRHDVDIGVIGEIRSSAESAAAVRAATTGHLIITSIHTNDSIGVFERLQQLGVDSFTLGDILVAVMSQRLVRRLCPYCKEKYELDLSSEKARHFRIPQKEGTMTFYKAAGCERCFNTGYNGRIAVNEILQIDPFIRHHIQVHSPRAVFEKYLKSIKFLDMYTDALNKARAGLTSLEELEPMCSDTLAFKLI